MGKLVEKLVLETKIEGKTSVVVVPKGAVIEFASEDDYPHEISDEDIKDAVSYMKKNE